MARATSNDWVEERQTKRRLTSLYNAAPIVLGNLESWKLDILGAWGCASLSRRSTHMPLRPLWAQGHVVYRRPLGAIQIAWELGYVKRPGLRPSGEIITW